LQIEIGLSQNGAGLNGDRMTVEVELSLRGPESYALARKAIEIMERHKVWPTPLNFELWLHYVGDPTGALGVEIERLVKSGKSITEAVAEELAAQYLPKIRLNEEIRDAGDQLSRQLESIGKAIQIAQRSNAAYGKTLAGASAGLTQTVDPTALKEMVDGLANATRTVQRQNNSLEKRLHTSTEEIVRLREHLEQVRREAMTDALTTLANRKALDEGLERACAEAASSGAPLTLAVIDIDYFKRFNDTWGHQTGDQVIRYVASVIGRVGEPPRLAARYGGEEFAIVFPGATAANVAAELEEARREIGSRALKRRSTNDDLGAVTVSMGVAEYASNESMVSFMERADSALYASKRGGRDRVTIAAPEIAPEARTQVSGRAA
jgi:diguanylate cyclase